MLARMLTRRALAALAACAALALQLVLPGLHPEHAAPWLETTCDGAAQDAARAAATDEAPHHGASCVVCAALAQHRGLALPAAAALSITPGVATAVAAPRAVLLVVPALTRAAPRAPPAHA